MSSGGRFPAGDSGGERSDPVGEVAPDQLFNPGFHGRVFQAQEERPVVLTMDVGDPGSRDGPLEQLPAEPPSFIFFQPDRVKGPKFRLRRPVPALHRGFQAEIAGEKAACIRAGQGVHLRQPEEMDLVRAFVLWPGALHAAIAATGRPHVLNPDTQGVNDLLQGIEVQTIKPCFQAAERARGNAGGMRQFALRPSF